MTYSDKALEIAEELEQASFDYAFSLISETKVNQALAKKRLEEARANLETALLSAHAAGQEEKRERAARAVEKTRMKEPGDDYGTAAEPDRLAARRHNGSVVYLAMRIRSLPITDSDTKGV
jgi:septum formation inhibitor MinC